MKPTRTVKTSFALARSTLRSLRLGARSLVTQSATSQSHPKRRRRSALPAHSIWALKTNSAALPLAMFALLLAAGTARAQTSIFIYQGKLTDGGTPANGNYDLQFALWDNVSGGTQIGSTQTVSSVSVANGIFTVTLDFGSGAFPGANRFLEISVRPAGGGSFTLLSPRQQLTSTPYAVRSLGSATADGLSSVCAGCVSDTNISGLAGSKITGTIPVASVPAGSANYIQNTTSPQSSSNFNISGNGTIGGNLISNGNVGIRTNAPEQSLSVAGGILVDQTNQNTGTSGPPFALTFGHASGEAIASNRNPGANQYGLDFYTLFINRMSITQGGNVGIGTTSPLYKLDVSGTVSGNMVNAATEYDLGGSRFANAPGALNTSVGLGSGQNTMGIENSFFGFQAGQANTGTYNSFFGTLAGQANTTGGQNAFFGARAGYANSGGTGNAFLGYGAGGLASGSRNSFFGSTAGYGWTGDGNTFIGNGAAGQGFSGDNNTALGSGTRVESGLSNATPIGWSANVTRSNSIVLGSIMGVNGSNADTNVGIGVTSPDLARLQVLSTVASGQGIYGQSNANNGKGVVGEASGTGGNSYGVWGLSSNGYAGYFSGNVYVTGNLTKGGGSFKIDHPLDPANKYLSHSFVESPDMMNIYNGNIITDARGLAMVVMPDYFTALNRDFRYQLTVIGRFAQAIVAREIKNNRFVIRTSKPKTKVSWQVTGIRQDAYANAHRIKVEEEKTGDERGRYLYPKLYGQPEERGVEWAQKQGSAQPKAEPDKTEPQAQKQ